LTCGSAAAGYCSQAAPAHLGARQSTAVLSSGHQGFRPCLAASTLDIVRHARALQEEDLVADDQPIRLEAAFFILALGLVQCDLGVVGAVGEIGAWRALLRDGGEGLLSFSTVSLVRHPDDPLFLCGPFQGRDESGFESQGFESPVATFDMSAASVGGRPRQFQHLAAAPLGLAEAELLRYSRGQGFRFLRLDRLRNANETFRLLRASSCTLVDGGILNLEGIQGMSDRPGLQEGFHRFMIEEDRLFPQGKRRLVPFLWAGKRGGLFLTSERHVQTYQQKLRTALPAGMWLDTVHDTKFLYGTRVVTAVWEAEPRHFEGLLAQASPSQEDERAARATAEGANGHEGGRLPG